MHCYAAHVCSKDSQEEGGTTRINAIKLEVGGGEGVRVRLEVGGGGGVGVKANLGGGEGVKVQLEVQHLVAVCIFCQLHKLPTYFIHAEHPSPTPL